MRRPLSDKIFIASAFLALAIFIVSCSKGSVSQSENSCPREQVAALITDSVSTLISDSGITRYRIEAPQWLVYDRTEPPYQEFPSGIYLEQFDENLAVQASLKADYAYYDETEQQWTLREKSIIEGVGFDSNEEMTKYTILHPTGVFPIKEE